MSKYDPAFWEINVDPEFLETALVEPDFVESLLITPEDAAESQEKARTKEAAIDQIRVLIRTQLTPRQRQVIELYFFQGKTQQEIAQILGISQQVVSKQIFGVIRDGRRVGGAVAKLRKLCAKQGIDPQKWV